MNRSISIFRKIALAYSEVCKPLCKELGLPQTAFDILMFLGNNPAYKTASEIVEIRRLKANLVSVNVEKLVQEGYLTRCAVAGDRRKTELLCTEKAAPEGFFREPLCRHGRSAAGSLRRGARGDRKQS